MEWAGSSIGFGLPDGDLQVFDFGINATGCAPVIQGCTDPDAINYDPLATVDDGSCITIENLITLQEFDTICHSGPKDNRINWVIQNRGTTSGNNNFENVCVQRIIKSQ